MALNELKYFVTANTTGFSGPMKAIGALAVTAFVAAIKVTAQFEKQLSKLRGVSGATEKQMKSLEGQARKLGKSTAFTATEAAGAQVELAKLGFTTNEILNSTGGVLDLAAGLGVSLAEAATLAGSTMRQFGIDSSDITRVVDILSKSTTESALDFSKLQESLKLIAPIANTVGVSMEETVGILETLANAGISGSIAGTSLRKAFIDLNAAGIPLKEALDKVKNSSDQLGTAVQLVGKRAATAFVVLAKNGYKSVTDFDGAANDLRVTMEDNLIGDFEKLKSAVTELGLVVGQANDGWLRTFVQHFTDLAAAESAGIDFRSLVKSINAGEPIIKDAVKKFGKTFEEAIEPTLDDVGTQYLAKLRTFKDRFDKQGNFVSTTDAKAVKKFFKELGVEVDISKSRVQNFDKTYKQAINSLAKFQKVTKDSGETKKASDAAIVKGLEEQLQGIKKQIALAPIQGKSELYILGLKLEKNKKELELADNIKDTNRLLITQATLEAKIAKIKGIKIPENDVSGAGFNVEDFYSKAKFGKDSFKNYQDEKNIPKQEDDPGYQKLIEDSDKLIEKNKLIEDSFESLGNNIASSLGATEGVFGAFVGTLIQGFLSLAAEEITSAATVALSSSVKTGAYGAVAAAAVTAGSIESLANVAGSAPAPAGAAVVAGAAVTKVAAYNAVAVAASIAGAAEGAAATGPAAPATLPIFIAAGIAAVAAAFATIGGGKSKGGGGSSAKRSAITSTTTTPSTIQGNGGGAMRLVSEVSGENLRFILQGANDNYNTYN